MNNNDTKWINTFWGKVILQNVLNELDKYNKTSWFTQDIEDAIAELADDEEIYSYPRVKALIKRIITTCNPTADGTGLYWYGHIDNTTKNEIKVLTEEIGTEIKKMYNNEELMEEIMGEYKC